MVSGLGTAARAMTNSFKYQDVIANNLANANTTAFRRSEVTTITFDEVLRARHDGTLFHKAETFATESHIDFTRGVLSQTGGDLDLALESEGFFVINREDGVRFTRRGDFQLNRQAQITDINGNQLLGRKGPIPISGKDFYITENGEVYVDGRFIDQILVGVFENPNTDLIRTDDGYFRSDDLSKMLWPQSPGVRQGFLEKSNVNVIDEMMKMISNFRFFEMQQRSITTIDATLQQAVNDVSRV